MPETERVAMELEQLKLLMNYTIFHIGIYMTLGGIEVAPVV